MSYGRTEALQELNRMSIAIGLSFLSSSPSKRGLLIDKVDDTSPAQLSGILNGDVVLSVNGHSTKNRDQFFQALRGLRPGDIIPFKILRGQDELTIHVQLGGRGYTLVEVKRIRSLAIGEPVRSPKAVLNKPTITSLRFLLKFEPAALCVLYSLNSSQEQRLHQFRLPSPFGPPADVAKQLIADNPMYLNPNQLPQLTRILDMLISKSN